MPGLFVPAVYRQRTDPEPAPAGDCRNESAHDRLRGLSRHPKMHAMRSGRKHGSAPAGTPSPFSLTNPFGKTRPVQEKTSDCLSTDVELFPNGTTRHAPSQESPVPSPRRPGAPDGIKPHNPPTHSPESITRIDRKTGLSRTNPLNSKKTVKCGLRSHG